MDFGFDLDPPGQSPSGWRSGVTGRGAPVWEVRQDPSAPSKPNVLQQSGSGTFPWIVRPDVSTENGRVARANALENDVSLYYTQDDKRITLKYVDAPVPAKTWHTLRVEFQGTRVRVALNGKVVIEMDDAHIRGAGAVGMWTKADSVTAFDDFSYDAK